MTIYAERQRCPVKLFFTVISPSLYRLFPDELQAHRAGITIIFSLVRVQISGKKAHLEETFPF